MVTYTGGRNRDGGTPAPGALSSFIASGVLRKCRREPAAALRRSVLDVVSRPTSRAACEAIAARAMSRTAPRATSERYGTAWREEWIGAYSDAPTTAPLPDP